MLSFTNEILFIGFEKKKKSISIFVLWKKHIDKKEMGV
jgi:hypothetical protein